MIREIRLTIKRNNQHRKITVYQPQLSIYKHVKLHTNEILQIL
jgi:hypothetical protein